MINKQASTEEYLKEYFIKRKEKVSATRMWKKNFMSRRNERRGGKKPIMSNTVISKLVEKKETTQRSNKDLD